MGTAVEGQTRPKEPTRVDQVVASIAARIERGLLKVGEKLPSIRASSANLGASKNTVVDAYDRLVAQGLVEARQGSGFYVCGAKPRVVERRPPGVVEAVDTVWLLREQLEQHYTVRVGDGRPPASWMEGSEIGPHLRPLTRGFPESYGSPYGFPLLRERIAQMLGERSIHADARQVLLTHGANHALDLLIRHLIQPGDTVLVDSPGYYPLFGKLRLAKADVVGVARGADGPDIDDLAEKARRSSARVFFTQSLAHNPTGCSITMPIAHRVLRIAAEHDVLIVESDPFADVLPPASVRLSSLDQLEHVIYVGTFAKTLSASLRCGYVAACQSVIDALCDLKMLTTVNSSGYVERVIHDLIVGGHYRRHLKRLAKRVDAATARSRQVLHDLDLRVLGNPRGGFYMWCALPGTVDDTALSRQAAERNILLAPGSVFYPDHGAHAPGMRVNIAYMDNPRFVNFMADALKRG